MTSSIHLTNKQILWRFWQQLNDADINQSKILFDEQYAADTEWNGPHPFNQFLSVDQLYAGYWAPLKLAVPDIRRNVDLLCAGRSNNKDWVTSIGYMTGTFVTDWLGIPVRGKSVTVRYGEFCTLQEGRITESYILLDLLDVLNQIGYRALPPNYSGEEGNVPGPSTKDGVLFVEADAAESQKSVDLVEAMLNGLVKYDQISLNSMEQHKYWHPEKMMWYGPSGIGTMRGLQGFEDYHQRPFLEAFPNRKGGNHKARFGDGNYVATTGWPSIFATHEGSYLGVPATGKQITMRVMDWWRREEDKLVENWVLIDLIDLFLQLGINLLDGLPGKISAD